jgi:hypothetical protein
VNLGTTWESPYSQAFTRIIVPQTPQSLVHHHPAKCQIWKDFEVLERQGKGKDIEYVVRWCGYKRIESTLGLSFTWVDLCNYLICIVMLQQCKMLRVSVFPCPPWRGAHGREKRFLVVGGRLHGQLREHSGRLGPRAQPCFLNSQ